MKNDRRGFSLPEVIMVVAIVGTAMLLAPKIFVGFSRFVLLHHSKAAIQRDARASLDNINRFLRQARASTVTIDQVTGQPPHSRINFTSIDGQSFQFYQKGTTLYQVSRSTTAIANTLRFLAFTYPRTDDPTIISVALTMEKDTYEGGKKALELSIEKVRVMN